ncbi:MAG TPA: S8 family serine peptidase [Flavobacteriales bacterium]|nr:S8 family serine peptidase [Flavobacteriales bacterium]
MPVVRPLENGALACGVTRCRIWQNGLGKFQSNGAGAVPGNYYPGYVPGQFPWYGVHVLNNSYGCYLNTIFCYNPLMRDAVQFAYRNKTVFAAARGNSGTTVGFLPATLGGNNLSDHAVLSVGASGTDGAYMSTVNGDVLNSSFSQSMDLIAPGTVRLVTSTADAPFNFTQCIPAPASYDCFRGTSAAAPHAAGVAALIHSEHTISNGSLNNLAPEDVERIMEKNADDIVGDPFTGWTIGYDAQNGHGRLQAAGAMEQVAYPYFVYHNQPPASSSFVQFPDQLVYLSGNAAGQPDGYYYATRVDATHTYANAFPATDFIIDHWPRESSTTGSFPENSISNSYGSTYEAVITDHTAQITMTTTGWYIIASNSGQAVSTWWPSNPYQAKTAYSLHLYKQLTVGESEAERAAMRLWPNPATDQVTLSLPRPTDSAMEIRMLDALGRKVRVQRMQQGADRVAIGLAGLPQGHYTAQLDWENQLQSLPFIIY